MGRTVAWIVPAGNQDWAVKPLLGKTGREYVEGALEEAGISAVADESQLFRPRERTLLVWEYAAGLSAITLAALAEASGNAVILEEKTRIPLAAVVAPETMAFLRGAQNPIQALLTFLKEEDAIADWVVLTPESHGERQALLDAASYAGVYGELRKRLALRHMTNGVILLNPDSVIIEAGVRIGPGTVIYPGNVLQGQTSVGPGCTLYPNNRMKDAAVGEGTTVESSVLLECSVGCRATVGPFAYLRPHTEVGDDCRVGDFVEIKNSSIGNGTKISHLTYVGDSDLGEDINLGCGVVFVNYDGKVKQRSRVGDHAFIGCNCNLIAPVSVGESAYIAAGSTIVDDVPKDALYVARSRGVIKEGWVKRRKEQGRL